MLDLGRHGGYILASYATTMLIIGALVWQSLQRYKLAKKRHAELTGPDNG